jgi:16S rRNA (cytidine1402-2'-O)-methyltransferase
VLFESPLRVATLLRDVLVELGDRRVAVARELTKLHEEVRRGTLGTLAEYYEAHPPRGEITVVVGGRSGEPERAPAADEDPEAVVAALKGSGAPAAVAKELAKRLGISRQDAYRLLTR